MTATTRSASITPSSMSFASSEASLTLCRGTLRTSIGAGNCSLFLHRGPGPALLQGPAAAPSRVPPRACEGRGGRGPSTVGGRRVLLQDGADVVARDGVGDVLEGCDDGAAGGSRAMS